MTWEETDTLVHFYEDQDKNLYLKLPGGNIRRVREEHQEKLRKSLEKIGYQPIPIQTTQNPTRTPEPRKELYKALQKPQDNQGERMKKMEKKEIERLLELKKEKPVLFKLYTLREGVRLEETKDGWVIRKMRK